MLVWRVLHGSQLTGRQRRFGIVFVVLDDIRNTAYGTFIKFFDKSRDTNIFKVPI